MILMGATRLMRGQTGRQDSCDAALDHHQPGRASGSARRHRPIIPDRCEEVMKKAQELGALQSRGPTGSATGSTTSPRWPRHRVCQVATCHGSVPSCVGDIPGQQGVGGQRVGGSVGTGWGLGTGDSQFQSPGRDSGCWNLAQSDRPVADLNEFQSPGRDSGCWNPRTLASRIAHDAVVSIPWSGFWLLEPSRASTVGTG